MNSRLISFLSFLITFQLLLLAGSCGKNKENSLSQSITENQTELLQQQALDFPSNTQVSVAIINNGVVSFLGLKNEIGNALEVNNHKNVFEIGSITKVFTSVLLADLAQDKKLQLNDNIDQYLEILLKDNAQISFVQLANHTSGLPRLPTNLNPSNSPINPYKDYDNAKLASYLSNEMMLSEIQIGTFAYSNLGVGLLGYILCEIEGQNYESLLQSKIFSLYNMSNSTTDRT